MCSITAKNIEEFQIITEKLNKLPPTMTTVSSVKNGGFGLECTLDVKYERDEAEVYLPSGANRIKHFDEYIGIYYNTYSSYLFKIEIKKGITYNYTFISEGISE